MSGLLINAYKFQDINLLQSLCVYDYSHMQFKKLLSENEKKKKKQKLTSFAFFPTSICDSEEHHVRKKKPSGCAKMSKTFRAILHQGREISSSGYVKESHSEFNTEQLLQNRSP